MVDYSVLPTADGSCTIYSNRFKACYHSQNGALTESEHVFIKSGFEAILPRHRPVNVLEVGLGTCLNAALTAYGAQTHQTKVRYLGIELYPLPLEVLESTGYGKVLEPECAGLWNKIIKNSEEQELQVTPWFSIKKHCTDFNCWLPTYRFDLIYFDAFAPDDQPEMWSASNFCKLFHSLNPSGVLVTYSAKGLVKQNLRSAGFKVERLQGPPGKRHMLRAWKVST